MQKNKSPSGNRRSIRLKEYNYSHAGAYFVTICTQNKALLFSDIKNNKILPNAAGRMVINTWNEIPDFFTNFSVDEFVLMPNHIHGIVWKNETHIGAYSLAFPSEAPAEAGQPQGVAPTSLFDVIYQFKSLTTNKYIDGVRNKFWKPFNKRVWQRNYYERVIRSEKELSAIREYILDNPRKWSEDKYFIETY